MIGGLNNGWNMAMATLAFERSAYAVQDSRLRILALGDRAQRQNDGRQRQRNVDEEDRPP